MTVAPFDPFLALRVLEEHGVRYVVIGGIAGRLWGSPTLTNDLDVSYERSRANLDRLAAALGDLEARLRGVEEEVSFSISRETLEAGGHFTLSTRAGNLDILAWPPGVDSFEELRRAATTMDLGEGLEVPVADLLDLIAMKKAAGRPKDLVEVAVLEALVDEIDLA